MGHVLQGLGGWRANLLGPRGVAAVSLLCVGVLTGCASVTAAGTDSARRDVVEATARPSGLTAQARQRIMDFLVDRFREHRISQDLVPIIMYRVNSMAAGDINVAEPSYPVTTSYPSIAQQISWQHALDDIASEFEAEFEVRYPPPVDPDIPIVTGPTNYFPRIPDANEIFMQASLEIRYVQRSVFAGLRDISVPRETVPAAMFFRARARAQLSRFARPVRIAPTGSAVLDRAIPQALAELRTLYPDIAIDDASFPVAADTANLLIKDGSEISSMRWAFSCAQTYCTNLQDFDKPLRHSQEGSHTFEERLAFLNTIYFTNPYVSLERRNAMDEPQNLIVQLDDNGTIIAALCATRLVRRESVGRELLETVERERLRGCLAAAMGYPEAN